MPQLLQDETNGEHFHRVELLTFLSWMHKHSEPLPKNFEEANELITRWLETERKATLAFIRRKQRRKKVGR